MTYGLRLSRAIAEFAFPGAMNTVTFEDDVAEILVPEWQPGDVVI